MYLVWSDLLIYLLDQRNRKSFMSLDQTKFWEFIENDDLESIAICIENGMDVNELMPIAKPNLQPYFPLFYSIMKKKERVSLFLIESGADVHFINSHGDSAAQFACFYNQIETLKVLIDKKAPLNQPNLKCFDLPVGRAISAGNIKAVELISPHLNHSTLEWAIKIAANQMQNNEIVNVLEKAIEKQQ